MTNLTRYTTADLPTLMDRITRNSIGMDEYFDRLFNIHETTSNYPPYNLIQINNIESCLEIALAGFKKEEVHVYTEYGKLFVKGQKEEKESDSNYLYKGLAQRSFTRAWTLSDDTEIREVSFDNGLLTVKLGKIVPEHHTRKDYL
jgi:molecular chaperone IbpA